MATVYEAGQARLTIVPDAREFRQKLEADLKRQKVEFALPITAELARAKADLDKFRAEQEAKAIHLRAEVDRDRLRKSLDGVRSDFEGLGESLGKALKIDAGVIGIDLLPALATGLVEVAGAVQQLAQAGLALPGILAGVGASVGTLALGLSGVKEAWSALDAVANQSASDQARTAQQAIAATNALRNAKVDEAHAQKDVSDAYRDARNQLEDLNIAQRGGVLSEKEAILGAAEARRDLATGRFKDALDFQQAQLRVEEADQRVVEAHQHNIEANQKLTEANAKGITQNDLVVAANERLVRSQQAVQSATAGLADLGAGGPADKAAEAMAKLAPNARQFVQTMIDLKPAFTNLRTETANNLFDHLGDSLKTLVNADLPLLQTGFGKISTALNGDFKQLFGSLGSDSTKGFLDRILGNTANADTRLKAAIDPMVHAIGVLTAAGSNALPRLADAVGKVADRFDRFISAADKDGRLDKWINDGLDGFTHLGDTVINIGKSFTALTEAVGGKGLLASLDDATKKLATFMNSTEGQEKLKKFFSEARGEFDKWKPLIADLVKSLPAVFDAAHDAAQILLPPLHDIGKFMADHKGLVEDVIGAYLLWKTVLAPIGDVINAVKDASKFVKLFIEDINGVGPAATKTAAVVEATAAEEVTAESAVAAEMQAVVAAQIEVGGGAAAAGGAAAGGAGAAGAAGVSGAGGAIAAAAGPLGLGVELGLIGATVEGQVDQHATALGGDPALIGISRYHSAQDIAKLTVPPGWPTPASQQAEQMMSAGALKGDPGAKWVVSSRDKWEQAGRYAWLANHPDADKQGFKPPGSYFDGGPTPNGQGPGPTNGFMIEAHGNEWMVSQFGRSKVPDSFLDALNKGRVGPGDVVPSFFPGGPIDDPNGDAGAGLGDPTDTKYVGPAPAGPNPADVGPQPIAPNPTGAGPGILNSVLSAAAQGAGGVVSNVISFAQSAAASGGAAGGGGNLASVPGLPGLIGSAGNPQALQAWGGQTANWLANFGAKTASSAAQIGLGFGLGLTGLDNSALSPSNPWNQAAQRTAGFYLGADSPLRGLMGGSADLSGSDIGSQTIGFGDGTSGQIPTYKTAQGVAGMPGDAPINGHVPDWDAIAQGESGGNWQIPSDSKGRPYRGGLQILDSTWQQFGGTQFAPTADKATPEQQKTIAQRILAGQGPGAWPNTFTWKAAPSAAAGGLTGAASVSVGSPNPGTVGNVLIGGNPLTRASSLGGANANYTPQTLTAAGIAPLFVKQQPGSMAGAPGWVNALASQFGLTATDHADTTLHGGSGQMGSWAFDFQGAVPDMQRFADFIQGHLSGQTLQAIWQNPKTGQQLGIAGGQVLGRNQYYNTPGGSYADHTDHVHWATDLPPVFIGPNGKPIQFYGGGLVPKLYDTGPLAGPLAPGMTLVNNQTGSNEDAYVVTHAQQQAALASLANHASTPTPTPGPAPDAQHLQQPSSVPSQPIPSPTSATPSIPSPTPTGGPISPSLAAPTLAPAPSNLDHNLKAIDTGIDSAAQALGQAASTAIGAAGGLVPGVGAIGPYVAGLINEGGKVAKDIVNVPSSFLVGNVTTGTQDRAYGAQLRPAQNNPNVAATTNITNISGNYELRSALNQLDLRQQQEQQSAYATHPRTP